MDMHVPRETYADPTDFAANLTDSMNAAAVAHHRRQQELAARKPARTHCEECGDKIPAARQGPGVTHCVPCKEDIEAMEKRFGR